MSPAFAIEIGVDPFISGVMIIDIARGSPANRLRFEIGDFIRDINGEKVENVNKINDLLIKKPKNWSISIDRKGKIMKLKIKG